MSRKINLKMFPIEINHFAYRKWVSNFKSIQTMQADLLARQTLLNTAAFRDICHDTTGAGTP